MIYVSGSTKMVLLYFWSSCSYCFGIQGALSLYVIQGLGRVVEKSLADVVCRRCIISQIVTDRFLDTVEKSDSVDANVVILGCYFIFAPPFFYVLYLFETTVIMVHHKCQSLVALSNICALTITTSSCFAIHLHKFVNQLIFCYLLALLA